MTVTLSPAQQANIARIIDAYCQANNTTWQQLTSDQAPAIAEAMNVHVYDNVADAIAQVLTKQA